MNIFKREVMVEYVKLDEDGDHVGRKTKCVYELWPWQGVGEIFTELKLEYGYDNFSVLSVVRL